MTASRRTILAGLAALPLAPVSKVSAGDAALLALEPAVEAAISALDKACDRLGAAERLRFAKQPSPDYAAARAAEEEAGKAWSALHDRIAAMPARTVQGLALKVRVCNGDPELNPGMMASVAADILAMAEAQA